MRGGLYRTSYWTSKSGYDNAAKRMGDSEISRQLGFCTARRTSTLGRKESVVTISRSPQEQHDARPHDEGRDAAAMRSANRGKTSWQQHCYLSLGKSVWSLSGCILQRGVRRWAW